MGNPASNPNSGVLSGCNRPVRPGNKFCEVCGRGSELLTCSKCGTQFTHPEKFCDLCGARFIREIYRNRMLMRHRYNMMMKFRNQLLKRHRYNMNG